MRNLVTGGAGFIGSHLIEKLLKKEETVICLDNLHTGRKKNFEEWIALPNFEFINHDVINPIDIEVDRIWHLACPASPLHYQEDPIRTARTNFLGTYNSLELALKNTKFAFVYNGQGSQHLRMGKQLYADCTIFRETIDRVS